MSKFENVSKEIAQILGQADEYRELVLALLEISKGVRGKLPVKEVAAELRALFSEDLNPLFELVMDGSSALQSRGAKFRAKLLRDIMDEFKLSEETALKLVLNEQDNLRKAVEKSSLNLDTKTETNGATKHKKGTDFAR